MIDLVDEVFARSPDGISAHEERVLRLKQRQLDAALWGTLGDRKSPVGKIAAQVERELMREYAPTTMSAQLRIRAVARAAAIAERRAQLTRLDTDKERQSVESAIHRLLDRLEDLAQGDPAAKRRAATVEDLVANVKQAVTEAAHP